ncbi:hypothetical protein QTH90_21090 [Variovorax sp. J2P1-59]|uniref:hypothetical protein n=1 Tax=Variovorax flavidus TaxID=3053501 RepID=UPI00257503AE|nr:hypothetical protein [Variovorax sp. J2P1-59]MDM0076918.1 hypothetical protein [Variovorax sp. J2P1-59]
MFKADAERERTQREIALADIKERSALAESYLKLILAKDTPNDGRAILYSALGQLKGHPLQNWAQHRYEQYVKFNTDLADAYKARVDATQVADEADGQIRALEADIQTLNVQILLAMDNPPVAASLQKQRIEKSGALARAQAARSVAKLTVQAAVVTIDRSSQIDPAIRAASAQPSPAAAIRSITERVDAQFLMRYFPPQAQANVAVNAPFLRAALQEFSISDARMVAAIVATIVVETPLFEIYEEPESMAQRYEGKLGNVNAGDGVKFRGRGSLGLTGRSNYARTSERLGLGTRLIDSPDDAKSPEVASRILVSWFADRDARFSQALQNDDVASARRLISGGTRQVERFETVYRKVLAGLSEGTTGTPAPVPKTGPVAMGTVPARPLTTTAPASSTPSPLRSSTPTTKEQSSTAAN